MRILSFILLLLLSGQTCIAKEAENITSTLETEKSIRLISPVGTMVRSAVIPGWGQIHSRNYFRGGLLLIGIGVSTTGALFAQRSFNAEYNNYALTASNEPDNITAVQASYDKANQQYKLRMFFIYTGIGIWVYSIVDSYVSANFYNATSQVQSIREDAQNIENLGLQVGITPSRLYLGVVKPF